MWKSAQYNLYGIIMLIGKKKNMKSELIPFLPVTFVKLKQNLMISKKYKPLFSSKLQDKFISH